MSIDYTLLGIQHPGTLPKPCIRLSTNSNSNAYRVRHATTPLIELMPLPSGAQFLNVIESVFSGMAGTILHNSDYKSVDECKEAIDRYFRERNCAFLKHPSRAGNKI
jgi:hypothetical protein